MRSALLAIALAAIPVSAAAASCPAPEFAPGVASVDAEHRLAVVERALARAEDQSVKWGGFWRATFQTTAAVQFGLSLAAKTDADRIDLVAGGFKSTVGLVFSFLFRLPAERHAGPYADRPWTEGPLCARLAAAEVALERDARLERRGRSIGMQALGLGFNIAVGVTQYILHKRLWSVLLASATGAVVGEIRVLTQPTVASDALDAYRTGLPAPTARASIAPYLLPHPHGADLGVAVTF